MHRSAVTRVAVYSCAVLMSAAILTPGQAQTDSVAAWLIRQSGHTKGIACVARCGSGGDVALSIARQCSLLVVGLDQSSVNVTAARNATAGSGLLNRRLYFDRGDAASTLPFADNSVDLLAMASVTDGDLASLSRTEMLRVLTPYNGVAIIGNTGSGLTQSTLQTWVNGFGVAGATVVQNSRGLWALIPKPPLPGSDNWTHRYHAADGNPVSQDTALKFPYMTQWMGLPFYELSLDAEVVVSNGRMFTMERTQRSNLPASFYRSFIFYARNVYNGQMLWTRNLPYKYFVGKGSMAAYGDTLLVMVGDRVACLDGETGAELGRITFAGLVGHVKKVMVLGDILVVLAGARDMGDDFASSRATWDSLWSWNDTLSALQLYGNEVAAYNLSTRQTLWRTATPNINIAMVGARDGRVYYYADKSAAVALDIATGNQVWRNSTSQLTGALTSALNTRPGNGMSINATGVVIGNVATGNLACLSAQNGSLIWTRIAPTGGTGNPVALIRDSMYTFNAAVSLANTGSRSQAMDHGGCGLFTAGPEMVFGQNGLNLNLKTGQSMFPLHYSFVKAPCDMAQIPANGLLIRPAFQCSCPVALCGWNVRGSAGSFAFNRTAAEGERLERGDTTVSSPLTPDNNDWHEYRANVQHSGSTPVSIPTTGVHQVFQYSPDVAYWQGPDLPSMSDHSIPTTFPGRTLYNVDQHTTHPITVGHYCFFGATDGKVRCIDLQSGRLVWMFVAGGELRDPPVAWNGRILFGSGDGYVYALEATTGRQLWRFRAAPVDRRVMMYGQLYSTWPVLGALAVQDGVVYAGAGFSAEDGTHLYALNAIDGSIRWQNDTLGHRVDKYYYGRNVCSGVTVARGRLWVNSSNQATTSLDLQTGRLVPGPLDMENLPGKTGQGSVFGRVSILKNRFIVWGDRRLVSDHNERWNTWYRFYRFIELDTVSGAPLYPEVTPYPNTGAGGTLLFNSGEGIPCWDDNTLVAGYNQSINCFNTGDFTAFLSSTRQAHTGDAFSNVLPNFIYATPPATRWQNSIGPSSGCVNAVALTGNAVVYAWTSNYGWQTNVATWQLTAVDRQTGSTLWTQPLPIEPLWDGMCVDRNGNVIVALRDGRILCFGGGTVSVRKDEYEPAVPAAPAIVPSQACAEPFIEVRTESRVVSKQTAPARLSANLTAAERLASLRQLFVGEDRSGNQLATVSDGSRAASPASGPVIATEVGVQAYAAADMTWRSERPCLGVAAVRASSSAGVNTAPRTVDRDLRTRWATASLGPQWVVYDLGDVQEVASTSIVWYSAKRTCVPFSVEASADGRSYVKVDAGVLTGRATNSTLRTFVPTRARYVRLTLSPSPGGQCPSIYEVGIHGAAGKEQASAE